MPSRQQPPAREWQAVAARRIIGGEICRTHEAAHRSEPGGRASYLARQKGRLSPGDVIAQLEEQPQKRRAAAGGKWHSACPEVRLYRSKVDGEKTLPPAGKLCNPCLRASRRPHGRGKTVTVAKGWGLVTNKGGKRLWKS